MPQPKLYDSAAQRQQAYRTRKKEAVKTDKTEPTQQGAEAAPTPAAVAQHGQNEQKPEPAAGTASAPVLAAPTAPSPVTARAIATRVLASPADAPPGGGASAGDAVRRSTGESGAAFTVSPLVLNSSNGRGEGAARRFLEFFTVTIRNPHTRRAYYRAVSALLDFCEERGVRELGQIPVSYTHLTLPTKRIV